MEYLTMICDIKNSRQLENRQAVQYQLIDMLKRTNIAFKDELVSPFIITIGDEWQGLLKFPGKYMKLLDYFHENLRPIDFYCGIGIGPVTIHDFELTVNQLDGPSFSLARKAIQMAKKNNYSLLLLKLGSTLFIKTPMIIAGIKLKNVPMIKYSTKLSSSNFLNRAIDFAPRAKPITCG